MNVTRFKRAIEIIESLPDAQLNLKVWQKSIGFKYIISADQATCGTIACAAGWLALNPEMHAQGLSCGHSGQPLYRDGEGNYFSQFDALRIFFGIGERDADSLFEERTIYEMTGDRMQYTDKEIWLNRARSFLAGYEGTI